MCHNCECLADYQPAKSSVWYALYNLKSWAGKGTMLHGDTPVICYVDSSDLDTNDTLEYATAKWNFSLHSKCSETVWTCRIIQVCSSTYMASVTITHAPDLGATGISPQFCFHGRHTCTFGTGSWGLPFLMPLSEFPLIHYLTILVVSFYCLSQLRGVLQTLTYILLLR